MERRELLTLLGAGAAGLMAAAPAMADDDDDKKHDHEHDRAKWEEQHEHVRTMGECALICNATASHCLRELGKAEGGDRELHAEIARATDDCQSFCGLAIMLMVRRSPMAEHAHKACADACRDCAATCDKGSHQLVKKCAEICRECERVCRGIVGKTV